MGKNIVLAVNLNRDPVHLRILTHLNACYVETTTNLRCVKSPQTGVLNYTAAGA
jgi:hypothetical protein